MHFILSLHHYHKSNQSEKQEIDLLLNGDKHITIRMATAHSFWGSKLNFLGIVLVFSYTFYYPANPFRNFYNHHDLAGILENLVDYEKNMQVLIKLW